MAGTERDRLQQSPPPALVTHNTRTMTALTPTTSTIYSACTTPDHSSMYCFVHAERVPILLLLGHALNVYNQSLLATACETFSFACRCDLNHGTYYRGLDTHKVASPARSFYTKARSGPLPIQHPNAHNSRSCLEFFTPRLKRDGCGLSQRGFSSTRTPWAEQQSCVAVFF